MMNANSEPSSIWSLPAEMYREIFSYLSRDDRRIARLTCRHWLLLINDLQKTTFALTTPESLDVCQKSHCERLGKLIVQNSTPSLPIESTYRIGIPPARKLALHAYVGQENILKLMRYYLKSCTTLKLKYHCFAMLSKPSLLANSFAFERISRFSFKTVMNHLAAIPLSQYIPIAIQYFEDVHNAAINVFLKHARFPNLKRLVVDLTIYIRTKFPEEDFIATPLFAAFLTSFGTFITRHASSINLLQFECKGTGYAYYPLIRDLQKLKNLNDLQFTLTPSISVPASLPEDLSEMVCSFKKLTHVILEVSWPKEWKPELMQMMAEATKKLCAEATNWTITSLLASPESKIKSICGIFNKWNGHLNFLRLRRAAHLKTLALGRCTSVPGFFPPSAEPLLPNLSILAITFDYVEGGEEDWRPAFFPWLIGMAPVLRRLMLGHTSKFAPTLANLQAMFRGLPKLRLIELMAPDEDSVIEEPAAVEQWLGTFPPDQLRLTKKDGKWTLFLELDLPSIAPQNQN